MSDVKFKIDLSGGADILTNNTSLRQLLIQQVQSLLPTIEAQFLMEFGVKGEFEIVEESTDRMGFMIKGANQQTTSILKANPKWLNQFVSP